jgi:hypothetical protein
MNRRGVEGTRLLAAYSLDVAASTIPDRSGNGRNGVLHGSAVTVAGPPSLV